MESIRIRGRNESNIRSGVGKVFIVDSEKNMQSLVNRLHEECRVMGLRISKSETEVLRVAKRKESLPVNANVEGTSTKQFTKFKCIGSLMSEDKRCDSDIRARIGKAKANFW